MSVEYIREITFLWRGGGRNLLKGIHALNLKIERRNPDFCSAINLKAVFCINICVHTQSHSHTRKHIHIIKIL